MIQGIHTPALFHCFASDVSEAACAAVPPQPQHVPSPQLHVLTPATAVKELTYFVPYVESATTLTAKPDEAVAHTFVGAEYGTPPDEKSITHVRQYIHG
jgi:hypothetical protein